MRNAESLEQLLEALVAAGGGSESVPPVTGMDRDQALAAAAELIDRGWGDRRRGQPG